MKLREKLLTVENLEYVYRNIEKLVVAGLNEVPELAKKKKTQYEKIKTEIENYMNFIRMGNFSKTVSEALSDAKKRSGELEQEIVALEFQRGNTFKTPPKEWINHRLERLNETLNQNTVASSLTRNTRSLILPRPGTSSRAERPNGCHL